MWKEPKFSRHHILPRHPYGNDNPRNIITIRDTTHRWLHAIFENKMIAEQLLRTLDFSEKAMKPEVVKWLRDTLSQLDPTDPHEWYIDDVIK